MKSTNKLLVLSTISCLLLSACQKDFISEDDSNPPIPTSTGDYLHKIFIIDSVAGVKDTFAFVLYEYDNARRVTSITDSTNYSGTWERSSRTTFHYQGTDTLPYKSVLYDENMYSIPLAVDTMTSFYQYDAAGRNRYDSSVSVILVNPAPLEFETNILVNNYSYSGNNIYRKHERRYSGTVEVNADTAQTDGRGNILVSRMYEIVNGVSELILTTTFTYDNKLNPFAKLTSYRTLYVVPVGANVIYEMQAKNNRLRADEVGSGGWTYTDDLTGKYTYGANGLPSIIKTADNFRPGWFSIHSFTYQSL